MNIYLNKFDIINEYSLLKSGIINVIKKYNNGEYKLNNKLIYYNSENECIDFFKYIMIISNNPLNYLNIKEHNLIDYHDFINTCVNKGYLKLLKFLDMNFKCDYVYNMVKLIYFSNNEDDIIYFIENIYIERDYNTLEKVICSLIEKGYLNIIKYLENDILKNTLYFYIMVSIQNKNIDILKYFLSFNRIYGNNVFYIALRVKNYKIIKYLIDNVEYIDKTLTYIDSYYKNIYYLEDECSFKIYGETVKYLINNGAEIIYTVFETFCIYENLEIIKFLLDKNNNSDKFPIGDLNYLLIKLINFNKINSIKFLVDNYNKFINSEDEELLKSINKKCIDDGYEIIKILMNYIELTNEMMLTSYENCNFNIVVLLFKSKKLDINILKYNIKKDNKYNNINNYLIENGLLI